MVEKRFGLHHSLLRTEIALRSSHHTHDKAYLGIGLSVPVAIRIRRTLLVHSKAVQRTQ